MKLKSKMSKIILFIVICFISIFISGILSQEGGPIWLGAVFILIAYKLIFTSEKNVKKDKNINEQTIYTKPKNIKEQYSEISKIFHKKYFLLLIGLSLLVITILLAFGKVNNKTKSSIIQNTEDNLIKIETKAFLEQNISKKNYTISELEKELASNNYNHSLLLNKALRFKIFMEAQDYYVELYSKNCQTLANQIGLENVKMKITYSKGIKNLNYLYDIAIKKEPNLPYQYNEILETQKKNIVPLLGFSNNECNQTLSTLQTRNEGIFNDSKLGDNIISFNYITTPEDELFDNHYQEFSSYNNAPEENFFLTIQLPKSWNIKEKKNYTNASTVAVIEPYEKYLNGIITISFYNKNISEKIYGNDYSDNDITEIYYEDDVILKTIIYSLNKELKETDNIKTTLYQIGGKFFILYTIESLIPNNITSTQKIKSLNAISFHNGKLIKISFGGSISQSEFSSFPYYSKVFFKVLNTIKFRELNENTIYLINEQNMKFLSVSIDGNNYKFLLDTGASSVIINKTVLSILLESGYLTRKDYIGKSMAEMADGSIVECENWKIPELKIGNNTIKDVIVSVINSEDSMLLFGIDGLNKLNVKRLNLKENEITLNRE